MLVILGLIWWAWPDLKERPGVEQVVEWFEELTPIPTCNGRNFCVAVADLQKDRDDNFGSAIVDAIESLQSTGIQVSGQGIGVNGSAANAGIEVIRIPRTISTVGNRTGAAEAGAVVEARRYLEKSHADLVIWGIVVQVGDKSAPRIFWTTSEATQRSSNLLNFTQSLELPEQFWDQLASMLQLVVVTQYAQVSAQEGRYVADKLAPFIDKVRALIPQTHGAGWTDYSRSLVKSLLAVSLGVYGEQAGDNTALVEAIGFHQKLLQEYPREQDPLDWAAAENNLGASLTTLGMRESGTGHLKQAVAAFRAALLEYTRERDPRDRALTENNLGAALLGLGERESGTSDLREAVVAFRASLLERTRERVPLEWAMTENNLGLALRTLGERESGISDLRQAVAALRASLLEYTRARVPLDWARTQSNLGSTLGTLGERESGTADLQQAVAAFRAALLEYSRERDPMGWAGTQNNLGNTLGVLGERDKDSKQLCDALQAHTSAWLVFREAAPYYTSRVLEDVQKDLTTIREQAAPALYATCLTDHAEVLKEMGLSAQLPGERAR